MKLVRSVVLAGLCLVSISSVAAAQSDPRIPICLAMHPPTCVVSDVKAAATVPAMTAVDMNNLAIAEVAGVALPAAPPRPVAPAPRSVAWGNPICLHYRQCAARSFLR